MKSVATPTTILARARAAVGRGVRYGLGKGGYHPEDDLPARPSLHRKRGMLLPRRALWCDCSGFVAWCLGRSRKPSKDFPWWLSTDSIWSDAKRGGRLFSLVGPAAVAPGDLVVYPDRRDDAGNHHEGHVGIVAEVRRAHGVIVGMQIVDCSSSQDGVTERDGRFFLLHAGAAFVRYAPAAAAPVPVLPPQRGLAPLATA